MIGRRDVLFPSSRCTQSDGYVTEVQGTGVADGGISRIMRLVKYV